MRSERAGAGGAGGRGEEARGRQVY
eukprot:COSAG02_NODE_61011_length_269_cov_1.511765_1_plen_24_part_10